MCSYLLWRMVNFRVEAGSFCSSSEVMFTKCVQNITEKVTKLKGMKLKNSARRNQMACIYFSKILSNNLYSSLILIFIYCLFGWLYNDPVSMECRIRWLMNKDLKGSNGSRIDVLYRNFPGRTGENHKNRQSEHMESRPRFEPTTSKIQI
jgi:hypothetical protein